MIEYCNDYHNAPSSNAQSPTIQLNCNNNNLKLSKSTEKLLALVLKYLFTYTWSLRERKREREEKENIKNDGKVKKKICIYVYVYMSGRRKIEETIEWEKERWKVSEKNGKGAGIQIIFDSIIIFFFFCYKK